MTEPFYTPEYLPPQRARTNVPAIISLITGIFSCVPLISLVAVITGIIGIRKAKEPGMGGQGLASAGLVLGIIGLLWTVVCVFIGAGGIMLWRNAAPTRTVVRQFATDLGNQNTSALMTDCVPSMDHAIVDKAVANASVYGPLVDSTVFSMNFRDLNGANSGTVVAKLVFTHATKTLTATLVKQNGLFKIVTFTLN